MPHRMVMPGTRIVLRMLTGADAHDVPRVITDIASHYSLSQTTDKATNNGRPTHDSRVPRPSSAPLHPQAKSPAHVHAHMSMPMSTSMCHGMLVGDAACSVVPRTLIVVLVVVVVVVTRVACASHQHATRSRAAHTRGSTSCAPPTARRSRRGAAQRARR